MKNPFQRGLRLSTFVQLVLLHRPTRKEGVHISLWGTPSYRIRNTHNASNSTGLLKTENTTSLPKKIIRLTRLLPFENQISENQIFYYIMGISGLSRHNI